VTRRDSLALRDYLEHIQQAIERIDRYLREIDYVGFLANEEKQDAVLRNLESIGEAAGTRRRHFPEFAEQYPDFPLRQAYETRNVLAHGYFKVDLAVVWRMVERDLPHLEAKIREVLDPLARPPEA